MSNIYETGLFKVSETDFISEPTYINPTPFKDLGSKVFDRESGHPIVYSIELARLLRMELIEAFNSDKPHFYEPQMFKDSIHISGELKRFICALAAYYDPRNKPKIPKNELIDGILDKDYCAYLKKVRSKAIVRSINGRYSEHDPDLDNIPFYRIDDVGQIFNYRHWFFWSEEDPNDEKWCFEPINELTERIEEEFKGVLASILPKDVQKVDRREILLSVTSSSADSMYEEGKSNPVYMEKQVGWNNTFSDKPLHAKLVYIQKTPGDTRRASIHTIAQSNTIKLIEKQTALIAEQTKHSCFTPDGNEFKKRYRAFKNEFEIFLCRDIKKDGLTKNRRLIVLVFDVLDQMYPHLEIYREFRNVYKEWTFNLAGETKIHRPPRGVGLGMSNALTTLIGCTIIEMTKRRLQQEGSEYMSGCRGLVYNDDCAIGFYDEPSLDNYDEEEDLVFEQLGLIKNKKKSWYADEFVLCEVYSNSLNDKIGYQLNLLYSPFHACNITHAKDLVQQILRFEMTLNVMEFLPEYYSYWGYEFYPGEISKPYRLGGWIPAVYLGVDTSFLWYEDNQEVFAALNVVTRHSLRRMLKKHQYKDNSPYNGPVEQLFGKVDTNGNDLLYSVNTKMKDVHKHFTGFKNLGTLSQAYSFLHWCRWMDYQKIIDRKYRLQTIEIYNMYARKYPYVDFLPPPEMAREADFEDFQSEVSYPPLFRNVNKFLGFLKFCNPTNQKLLKVMPYPVPPTVSAASVPLSNEERKQSIQLVKGLEGHYSHVPTTFHHLSGQYDFSSTGWLNPENVALAWKANFFYNKIPFIPEPIPEKEELWNFRKSHMNIWLNQSEFSNLYYYLVQRLGWAIMGKIELMDDQVYTDYIHSALKELPRTGPAPNPYNTPLPPPTVEENVFFNDAVYIHIQEFLKMDVVKFEPFSEEIQIEGTEEDESSESDFWERFIPHDVASQNSGLSYSEDSNDRQIRLANQRDHLLVLAASDSDGTSEEETDESTPITDTGQESDDEL
jgi:hypothetical protein